MKVWLVIGWEQYEQDVIIAVCKTEAIAKETVRHCKESDEDGGYPPLFEGYDIKEMDVVE